MADKAVITWRQGARTVAARTREADAVRAVGMATELNLPNGTLVRGSAEQYRALMAQGYRVKVLPDTNLLRIGAYVIDTDTDEAEVPAALDVTANEVDAWPHHLVQLVAPALPDWVDAIAARGLDVVEPVSGYALFVYGPGRAVSALRDLPFVAWTGPFKPAYRMLADARDAEYVLVGVYPSSEARSVADALASMGEIVEQGVQPTTYGGEFATFRVRGPAIDLPRIAALPYVRWVEAVPRMLPLGERESQISAGNLTGAPPNTTPVLGYQTWLGSTGVSGAGVTVAIVDSGVDANGANNTAVAHVDLRGRQTGFVDYSGGVGTTDRNGHGTLVAGIAIGNAASGQVEAAAPNNFRWGQGVAPAASFVTQNFLDASVSPQPAPNVLIRDAITAGARVMNNSWGGRSGQGYTAQSRLIDFGVRDPNPATADLEHMAIVCSAGNEGGFAGTIVSPHESKNDIVVGNSLTGRPGTGFPSDDVRGIAGTSSRGPSADGRLLPTLVAPGTDVTGAQSRTGTMAPIAGTGIPNPANAAQTIDAYVSATGTSAAAPHVAGACALMIEWWRNRTGGKNPSPAMLKALLVTGAQDLAGGENWRCLNATFDEQGRWGSQVANVFRRPINFVPTAVVDGTTRLTHVNAPADITAAAQWAFDAALGMLHVRTTDSSSPGNFFSRPFIALDSVPIAPIPNNDQGWGRLNLSNMLLQSPVTDRGPAIYVDQKHALTANGDEFVITVAPVDTARPMRVTLVWTDAAGAAGGNPVRINDLDLEVTRLPAGPVFLGNVFANGVSTTGGSSDSRNNVECVFVQQPSGTYDIRVIAFSLLGSAHPAITTRWQDFALVIDNADVPAAAPVNVSVVLDRSGSMLAFGYDSITRIASRQSIDLMHVLDRVGVVSFGSTAVGEFPPGGPAVQAIAGQSDKDAAMTSIDSIAFGGCTFMGGGIQQGGALLSAVAAPRAVVLFSDGYDNKGCQFGNTALPSALDAANALPADIRLFSCAMGPAADQALLESVAAATGGRYYFMPTIDDLFEIYNYIRGRVTGDSIAVNQSAMASVRVLPAVVDALAEEATFTVAWANTKIRGVLGRPRAAGELGVQLRDPWGRLIPVHASFVREQVGNGYILLRIADPAPGEWRLEVETLEQTHTRFTAGVFLRSPIRLDLVVKSRAKLNRVVGFSAAVLDGRVPVPNVLGQAAISSPIVSWERWTKQHRDQLDAIEPPKMPGGDVVPADVARLSTLIASGGADDLLARASTQRKLTWARNAQAVGKLAGTLTPVEKGSHVVTVRVRGATPRGVRFVRQDQVSVQVG